MKHIEYELEGWLGYPVTGSCTDGTFWFFHHCGFQDCDAPHSDVFFIAQSDDKRFFAVNGRCYRHAPELEAQEFDGKKLFERVTVDEVVAGFNEYCQAIGIWAPMWNGK